MDVHHEQATGIEEEWIAKYRAALQAAPIENSRFAKFRATLARACCIVVASAGRIVDTLSPTQVLRPSATRQPGVAAIRTFQTSPRKQSLALANDEGVPKRAS